MKAASSKQQLHSMRQDRSQWSSAISKQASPHQHRSSSRKGNKQTQRAAKSLLQLQAASSKQQASKKQVAGML